MNDEAAGAAPRYGRTRAYGIAPSGFSIPASARLGPVRLQVSDLERSARYYDRTLGLVPFSGSAGAGLALAPPGRAEPLIFLSERPGARAVPPRGRLGLYHFALRVPDREALGRLAIHLRDLGVRMGAADHRVSEALYLTDPDGLGIEVYRDRPTDQWESSGRQLVMTTEALNVDGLIAEVRGGSVDSSSPDRVVPGRARGSGAPSGLGDRGLPSRTAMGHVHLRVADLQEAARFYHRGLGLEKVVWDYPGALFLSAGGYHHHVGLNSWAPSAEPPGADDARLLSWTVALPTAADVARAGRSLEDAGFEVMEDGRPDSGGTAVAGFEGRGRSAGEESPGRLQALDPWGTAVEVVAGGPGPDSGPAGDDPARERTF